MSRCWSNGTFQGNNPDLPYSSTSEMRMHMGTVLYGPTFSITDQGTKQEFRWSIRRQGLSKATGSFWVKTRYRSTQTIGNFFEGTAMSIRFGSPGIGLWNATLTLSEKGFYGMSFLMSLFAAIAVQKNIRDAKKAEESMA
jgi:hypothetical protein